MRSLSDWITEVSENLGENPDNITTNYWSAANIVRQIDKAIKYAWGRIIAVDPYYFKSYVDISTVADQECYDLPPNFAQPLEIEDREGVSAGEHGYRLWRRNFHGRYRQLGWDLRAQQFCLHSIPDSVVASKYRIHYTRSPADVTYGTAAAGGATSITLATTATYGTTSNQNDYYNGSRILFVSGTGAGEIRTISDYVGSTRVATIDSGTTPTTTTVYSILPDIPDFGVELVGLRATMKCLMQQDSNPKLSFYRGEYKEERANFLRIIRGRYRSSAHMVTETGEE